jgi:amidase
MNRRDLLRAGALVGVSALVGAAMGDEPGPPPFEWEEVGIAQLQEAMRSGKATAASLTRQYLARIAQVDKGPGGVNSVIELNPDAMAIAETLDEERKTRGARGPLHGIPVMVKDNLDTHDRMMTTAGSLALLGSTPAQDSFVVKKLRDAGAVILGKTNLSEWANVRSPRSTSGWSARGGLTRNPYALDRNPSGSSSGSGAAVSANLCAAAIGTETDGSIISPSTACGIVGLKPTLGLVSRSGIIPISASQDTAGPMARTVADAAALLSAIAGPDPKDIATEPAAEKAHKDYTQFLDASGLKGARIGVARQMFRRGGVADAVYDKAIETLKAQGAELIDPANIPSWGKLGDAEFQVLLYEFKAGLNAYFASLGDKAPVKSLADLIDFNNRNADKELIYFGQENLVRAEKNGPLTDEAYITARKKCVQLTRAEGIDAVMDQHRLDAVIAPSGGPAAKTDLIYGDRSIGGSSSYAAVAGYPNITVPAGHVFGLPVGLSFFGRAWSEPTLLKLAFAFEQATRARKPPKLLATVG